MAKRRKSLASLSQEQAHQALTFLVQEGKLAAGAVQKALDNRERLIREIRERLVKLGVESVRMAERVGKTAGKELPESGETKPSGEEARRLGGDPRRAAGPGAVPRGDPSAFQGGEERNQGDSRQVGCQRGDRRGETHGEVGRLRASRFGAFRRKKRAAALRRGSDFDSCFDSYCERLAADAFISADAFSAAALPAASFSAHICTQPTRPAVVMLTVPSSL